MQPRVSDSVVYTRALILNRFYFYGSSRLINFWSTGKKTWSSAVANLIKVRSIENAWVRF